MRGAYKHIWHMLRKKAFSKLPSSVISKEQSIFKYHSIVKSSSCPMIRAYLRGDHMSS